MLVEDHEIEDEVLHQFSSLYSPLVGPPLFVEGVDWCLDSFEDKVSLEAPYSWLEVKRVVFELDRNAALGLNDFYVAFF